MANDRIFMQNDKVKSLQSAMLLSDVLEEREKSHAVTKSHRAMYEKMLSKYDNMAADADEEVIREDKEKKEKAKAKRLEIMEY